MHPTKGRVYAWRRQTAERFWARCTVTENGCLEWQGARDKDGYGLAKWHGRQYRAHRLAWYLTFGEWPTKMVLHHCDNPPCLLINPDGSGHLFQGTGLTNILDSQAKGRYRNGRTKLTREMVQEIRHRIASGEQQKAIAAEYGVSPSNIRFITAGTTWKEQ